MLVVAGLHLLGGWVYSIGFKRDVLALGEKEVPAEIVVRALSGDTITLEAASARQDIGHPGTLGLYWDGGYSQVGEVVDVIGGKVVRRFQHLKGRPPPVCSDGHLEACEAVSLGGYAYPDDPSDVSLAFKESTYLSPLGPVGAWIVEAPFARRWTIHIHGWTAHRREAIRLLKPINESGWNSMVIDYRNDEGAPTDPSGLHRFGLSEWQDVEAAVESALDREAAEIVLVGYSTGAAHAMSFLERSDLASVVTGLIFDSPNIDLAATIRLGSRGSRFPVVRVPVTRLVTEFGMWISDLRWHVDWVATNYLLRASETIKTPTLLFHGTADQRVPVSVARRLAQVIPGLVTYVETPTAGHVMSWNADRAQYERELRGFLRRLDQN